MHLQDAETPGHALTLEVLHCSNENSCCALAFQLCPGVSSCHQLRKACLRLPPALTNAMQENAGNQGEFFTDSAPASPTSLVFPGCLQLLKQRTHLQWTARLDTAGFISTDSFDQNAHSTKYQSASCDQWQMRNITRCLPHLHLKVRNMSR